MNEYIDVRGPYPVYIRGLVVVPLEGAPRDITLVEALLNMKPDGQSWHPWPRREERGTTDMG